MATLNKVMLIGRLGRDPELRYTQAGKPVAGFSIATDESYKDQSGAKVERTEWHDIVVWDRSGENAANMLRKGSLIYLEGRLQTRKYTDQQGQERRKTEIVCEKWQFLEPKSSREGAWTPPHDDADFPPPPGPRGGRPVQQGGGPGGQGSQGGGQRPPQRPAPAAQPRRPQYSQGDDLGPAFPSEASGMDDVPF